MQSASSKTSSGSARNEGEISFSDFLDFAAERSADYSMSVVPNYDHNDKGLHPWRVIVRSCFHGPEIGSRAIANILDAKAVASQIIDADILSSSQFSEIKFDEE